MRFLLIPMVLLLACNGRSDRYERFAEEFFNAALEGDSVFIRGHVDAQQPREWLAVISETERDLLQAAVNEMRLVSRADSGSSTLLEFMVSVNGREEKLGLQLTERENELLVMRIQLSDRL